MGVVYKAEDQALPRLVALKLLSPRSTDNPADLTRFLHEARALSLLQHPNITTIHMLLEHEGRPVIVSEFVSGGTLKGLVRSGGAIPADRVVDFGVQIASGLSEAHRKGIVHRDLKSENVLVTESGQLKIADFGLAKLRGNSSLTKTGTMMGTLAYMSPEQVRGEEIDHRSDLYSFGVILYELLGGSLPFRAEHEAALMYEILHQEPRPLSATRPDVPAGLLGVIERAMAKDVDSRYQTADEILRDLDAVRRGGAPAPRSRPPRPRIRKSTIGWFLGALVLAGGIVIGLLTDKFMPSREKMRVAVLPFRWTGAVASDLLYLSDGIGEQLVNKLTGVRGFQVTPWVSSRRYLDTATTMAEIAAQLNVDLLIVGTIGVSGSRIRTSVALIDAKANGQIWANDYEGGEGDLFDVPTEIALGAVHGLRVQLSSGEVDDISTPPAASVEAFEFYIKGSKELQFNTPETNDQALAYFEKAVRLDSGLAEAHVGIGTSYYNRYFYGWGGAENLDLAEKHYREALRLDRGLSNALGGLVLVLTDSDRPVEALELSMIESPTESEDVGLLFAKGTAILALGLTDRALPYFDRILMIDPGYQGAAWYKVIAHAWSDQPEAALNAAERYFRIFGEDPEVHTWVGLSYFKLGNVDAARLHFTRAITLFGNTTNWYVNTFAALASFAAADSAAGFTILNAANQRAEELLARHPTNYRVLGMLAENHALLGNLSRAAELLESARFTVNTLGLVCKMFFETGDSTTFKRRLARWEEVGFDDLYIYSIYSSLGFFGMAPDSARAILERTGGLARLRAIHEKNARRIDQAG